MKNHLFTIWITDNDWDGMPFLWEICIASVQVLNNTKVTIYTNHKLHLSFLDRTITDVVYIPDEWMNKAKEIDPNSKAHQSDYLRLKYLSEFGGVYFDTDILFFKSFQKLWEDMEMENKPVLYTKEDKYMITNCMILCNDVEQGKTFFDDIIKEYENRFVKHSYLHNSQKFMNLMERRYPDIVYTYEKPSLFIVNWNAQGDMKKLYNLGVPEIGQHLFSSNSQWDNFRMYLDKHCYDKEPDQMILKHIKLIIDNYIDLMKEADTNG